MKPNKNFANEINADRTKSRELEETPPLKNGFEFLSQSQKETCESKTVLVLLFGAASQLCINGTVRLFAPLRGVIPNCSV